jgi:hypothetical protein
MCHDRIRRELPSQGKFFLIDISALLERRFLIMYNNVTGITEEHMKRKINITMDDLIMGFDTNTAGYTQYLNLETGGIAKFSKTGDSFDEDGNVVKDLKIFGDKEKYIALPQPEPNETLKNMEQFIDTKVNSERLRTELRESLGKKNPHRAFRDTLMFHSRVDREWFEFREEDIKKRIRHWLIDNDLELKEGDRDSL